MAERKNVLEWVILLSDAEWERGESLDDLLGFTAGESPEQTRPEGSRRVSRPWMMALAALLVVASTAYTV